MFYYKNWLVPVSILALSGLTQACAKKPTFSLKAFSSGGQLTGASNTPVTSRSCGTNTQPGHVSLHRLNNDEYNNTVRDLLFTNSRPADHFPASGLGTSGFSNDSDRLNVFSDLVAGFSDGADALATEVIASKGTSGGAYARIAPCAVGTATPSAACAATTIRSLASRAFRRPVNENGADSEFARLLALHSAPGDFDTGLKNVVTAILLNPSFLFVSVTSGPANEAGAIFKLNDYEIATRLSYFLWQSMPDTPLMDLAAAGQLRKPAILKAQVVRMLQDPKVQSLARALRNDWFGLDVLSSTYHGLDDTLRTSMLQETDLFLVNLIKNDLSPSSIVKAETSYVNKQLADHYGIPFPGADPAQFVSVNVAASGRQGVIGQAAFLTAFAGGLTATHPVKRGKAVMTRMMCIPVEPPPAGIKPVPDVSMSHVSPREALIQHASSQFCNHCHQTMDVLGLGLESFNSFGQLRTVYDGTTIQIDPSGVLPSGKSFLTAQQMLQDLGGEEAVRSCIARQVASFALTRAMKSDDDKCVTQAIGQIAATDQARFSDLIFQIVISNQFLMQTGEAPL